MGKRHVVHRVRNPGEVRDSKSREHGAVPVASTTLDRGDKVDDAEGEDALDGAGDYAQGKDVCVILIPGLDVEGENGSKEGDESGPGLSEVRCASENEEFEGRVACIDACRACTVRY